MMQMNQLVNLGDSGIPMMHHIPTPTGHAISGPQTQRLMMKHGDEKIIDVWKNDLEDAFKNIRKLINQYNYVAMDTEFPGVCCRPIGEFKSTNDFQYQCMKCNVDVLKVIQIGLTFMDENGQTPSPTSTYQFNFQFNLNDDMFAPDSIDLLQNSGIQFQKHSTDGIDPFDFAELLIGSGLILMKNVYWLSFHSSYDFSYLLHLLTTKNLPDQEANFHEFLNIYFPKIYDVKYLMKSCKQLKGGLQEVADGLEIVRIGQQHQAGSDSLLTGQVFFKMREMFFENMIDEEKYLNHLYGLGGNYQNGGLVSYESNAMFNRSSTNNAGSPAPTLSNA